MKRTPLTDGRWFDLEAATGFAEETRWDGSNHVSVATGSQWDHQELYRTASGRWVLHDWGRSESYTPISDEAAMMWLIANKHPLPPDLDPAPLCLDTPAPRPGRLDLSRAEAALVALRGALVALNTPGLPPAQSEALRDALETLRLVERDMRDAGPPPGEHPAERDDGEPGPGSWCIADPHTRAHLGAVEASDRDTAANLYAQRRGQPEARFLRRGVYEVAGVGEVLVFSPTEDVDALQGGDHA